MTGRGGDGPGAPEAPVNRWVAETGGTSGPGYAARFAALAAAGEDVHGEARCVDALLPRGARVLDAGCGTGRVALELARRGHQVAGVDLDASMLDQARAADTADTVRWVLGDLLTTPVDELGPYVGAGPRRGGLDAVVLAGNVVVYLTPGTEAEVVARLAGLLAAGGVLVAGFAADRHVAPADLARWCAAAGLEPQAAWGAWDGAPPGGGWSVQVHRRPDEEPPAAAGPTPPTAAGPTPPTAAGPTPPTAP